MSDTWTCQLCTVKNDVAMVVCNFCQATPEEKLLANSPVSKKRKTVTISPPSLSPTTSLFTWQCKVCTLCNPFRMSSCDGCGSARFRGNEQSSDDVSIVAHVNPSVPEAKRPKLSELEDFVFPIENDLDDLWECRFCTFRNEAPQKECQGCETAREATAPNLHPEPIQRQNSQMGSTMTIIIDEEGPSFNNGLEFDELSTQEVPKRKSQDTAFIDTLKGSCAQCPICGCEFEIEDIDSLTEHASLHVSGDSSQFQVRVVSDSDDASSAPESSQGRKNGKSNYQLDTFRFTTAYEHQYARSYLRSFSDVKSIAEIQNHMNEVTRTMLTAVDSVTCDRNLISALHEHYRLFPNASKKVALATHVKHFSSGHGDRGWGCGYRNIQMMASSLLEIPHFNSLLFGGIGHIPTIPVLQQCLEAAWAEGFDGSSSLKKDGVFGGNRWIGTYEAVSLFRNFNVHVEMQTFGAKLRPGARDNGGPAAGSNGNVVSVTSFAYRRYQPAIYVPHAAMFDWVWKYFDTRKSRGDQFIPPLYLQHDGHSRTIVGAENLNGRIALLIFDPSFPPKDTAFRLRTEASVPDVLRKTLSEFRHQNYQVAYVADTTKAISQRNRSHFKNIVQPRFIQS